MAHSLLAVLGGFAAMALLVMVTTAVAAALLVPGGVQMMAQPGATLPRAYLTVNVLCSALAALVGGGVTARIATTAPLGHGAGLAVLMVLMSVGSMRQAKGRQPRWYQLTLMIAMPLVAIVGAWATGAWSR